MPLRKEHGAHVLQGSGICFPLRLNLEVTFPHSTSLNALHSRHSIFVGIKHQTFPPPLSKDIMQLTEAAGQKIFKERQKASRPWPRER